MQALRVCFLSAVSFFLIAVQSFAEPLSGSWKCSRGEEVSTLVFQSGNQLLFDGELFGYSLAGGNIRIIEEYGPVDYPYSLKNDELRITYPDGSVLRCGKPESGAGGGRVSAGSGERFLSGMLCSWSGSSSGYSGTSYSSSTRVFFDGAGNFSYGTESSFSSREGLAYGGNNNPENTGTYSVEGSNIHLSFGDGSSGVAMVNMRQNDGRITEIQYDGKLYATGLCE